jgi:hypothetical protein
MLVPAAITDGHDKRRREISAMARLVFDSP